MKTQFFENLERRTLLADFSAAVNFQPDGAPVPPGYVVDSGQAFGNRGAGLSYGWSSAFPGTFDRNSPSSPDQRFDTWSYLRPGQSWEITVPNGIYAVRLVAGDPGATNSVFRIKAESTLLVSGTPTTQNPWVQGRRWVEVRDGKLTIANARGYRNNKLCFIDIQFVASLPKLPAEGTWSRGPNLPVALGEVAGGVIGNTMYVVGDGSGKTLAYDLNTNSWRDNLAQRPVPAKDQLAEVVNGKLYVFGGVRYPTVQQQALSTLQIYDPATNSWSFGASTLWPVFAAQTAVINGQIYVAGGVTQGNVTTNRVMRYDPLTNTWTERAPMPQGRNSAPAGTDGSRLFLFGGRDGGDEPGNGFNTVQIYNPSTNSWLSSASGAPLAPLPQARAGIVKAPLFDGEFYVIGGETVNGAGATPDNVYQRVDIYNPQTNTWRRGPDMPTARHGIFPMTAGNRILVPGGGTRAGASNSNILEVLTFA